MFTIIVHYLTFTFKRCIRISCKELSELFKAYELNYLKAKILSVASYTICERVFISPALLI